MKTQKTNSITSVFDFFKIQPIENKPPGNWALTLFTIHKTLSGIKFRHICIITSLVVGGLILSSCSQYIPQLIAFEQSLQEKFNAQEKQKEFQNLGLVKLLNASDIAAINAHIELVRTKEIERLIEIYWTLNYVSDNDRYFSLADAHANTRKSIDNVNQYYKHLEQDITIAFNALNLKNANFVDSSESGNILEDILRWDQMTKSKTVSFSSQTNTAYKSATQYLESPEKLAKFIASKKPSILSHEGFE